MAEVVTPIRKVAVMGALVAPPLELRARTWSFAAERAIPERTFDRLPRRTPRLTAAMREISAWRERFINQRKSLQQLWMHRLERTRVWTGATYIPGEHLDGSSMLELMETHTTEALGWRNTFKPLTPNLLERTAYSKLNVRLRRALSMRLAAFSAVKNVA